MSRVMLQIGLSERDLLRVAAKFGLTAQQLSRATVGAINDTAITGRGRVRRRIRQYVTLPARSVNQRVIVAKRASEADPVAIITMDRGRTARERPTLMSYKGKPSRPPYEGRVAERRRAAKAQGKRLRPRRIRPFTYQILKSGSRQTMPNAFVARPRRRGTRMGGTVDIGNTGNVQAFVRRGRSRYPLHVPKGPSVAAIWQNESNGVAADVLKDLRDALPRRIQGRARMILSSHFRRVAS